MTGGLQLEYTYDSDAVSIETVRAKLEDTKKEFKVGDEEVLNSIQVYKITGENKIGVIAGINSKQVDEKQLDDIKTQFKSRSLEVLTQLDPTFQESLYINIGESFGAYIRNTALLTLGIAIVGIGLYVAFAFS